VRGGAQGSSLRVLVRARRPALSLALTVVAILSGCGPVDGGRDGAPNVPPITGPRDDRIHVVVSMSVLADLVAQVAVPGTIITSLVPLGGDPHTYEATPADARAIQDADLILGNGAGLEPWFSTLVAGNGRTAVMLADALADSIIIDADGALDPHLWMVPTMAVRYVERIADELTRLDPDEATSYLDAAQRTRSRFEALDEELRQQLARIPADRRVIVTSHDAYAYFAEHYGFEVAAIVGVSTDEEPSAARVRELVELIRTRGVPTVFAESSVNPAVIRRIAQDAGVGLGRDLYGDSLGPPGSGAEDYVSMLRWNVAALVDGLADR